MSRNNDEESERGKRNGGKETQTEKVKDSKTWKYLRLSCRSISTSLLLKKSPYDFFSKKTEQEQ